MNLLVLLLGTCAWGLLFLQALHTSPQYAPALFFASGVAQWVCGVAFSDWWRKR